MSREGSFMQEPPKQPYDFHQQGMQQQAGYMQPGQGFRQNERASSPRDHGQFGYNAAPYRQNQNIPQHNQVQPDPRQNWKSDKGWYLLSKSLFF